MTSLIPSLRAKYPLAIVAKVLAVIGNHTLSAYDIGCRFSAMVKASSLRPTFTEQESRLCADFFHGFAHNYVCQTQHHPLGIEGAVLKTLELWNIFSVHQMCLRLSFAMLVHTATMFSWTFFYTVGQIYKPQYYVTQQLLPGTTHHINRHSGIKGGHGLPQHSAREHRAVAFRRD
jgi:hypothetical protein